MDIKTEPMTEAWEELEEDLFFKSLGDPHGEGVTLDCLGGLNAPHPCL
jgi:hypothetical protein